MYTGHCRLNFGVSWPSSSLHCFLSFLCPNYSNLDLSADTHILNVVFYLLFTLWLWPSTRGEPRVEGVRIPQQRAFEINVDCRECSQLWWQSSTLVLHLVAFLCFSSMHIQLLLNLCIAAHDIAILVTFLKVLHASALQVFLFLFTCNPNT